MSKSGIPSQGDHNPEDPEEHFVWALRSMPMFAGVGAVTHPGILRGWSKHLWECGFAHRDYLSGLADADGTIPVSRLPEQAIRFQPAFRGPQHGYNNAATWVATDTPEPQPVRIPNIRELTIQEQHALLYQFQELGMVPADPAGPATGELHDERAQT
ncbi:hypothetical protein BST33_00085 [Mycolicibacter minnesotensis]|uniref:Uncharacterized protein n=1 Tax=Mycolicibacter minnesotensis TaxID=1118379 RepID=A0A7I7R8B3_9MYCO|nr:DUF2744 domain-containing protein [Mycolicibacter minnesotensis]ORB04344.1 hypothetical protein BST33_00085 [Mycolicibacter minnesotensis]BBY34914.1 hypothetical protein MMIN_29750 [Mycolicibacter minnesotensis]